MTRFSVQTGSLRAWTARLTEQGASNIASGSLFGAVSVGFDGSDGERLMLVEAEDPREPWTGGDIGREMVIRGFHSAGLNLDAKGTQAACDILALMGYTVSAIQDDICRLTLRDGNGADIIDRDYFHAIYFRIPGGILFEIATNEPGFIREENDDRLGTELKLSDRHEHLRQKLQQRLPPLDPV